MRFARTRGVRAKRAAALYHPDIHEHSLWWGARRLRSTKIECIRLPAVQIMEIQFPPACPMSTLRYVYEKYSVLVLYTSGAYPIAFPSGLLPYRPHAAL